jgi:hypothetical protein
MRAQDLGRRLALLICLGLAACSKSDFMMDKSAQSRPMPIAESADNASTRPRAQPEERRRYLAYEHNLVIDAARDRVAPLYRQVQEACEKEAAEQCVILRASLDTRGDNINASLRLRAKPAGVRRIAALIAGQGEVVNQGLSADDLTAPVADSEKRLAMLTDYRTRLEGLRERAGSNIEALIKVNQELAQVQSQIESATGERARLMQRVDTELLSISIYTPENRSAWRRVGRAFDNFGQEFANAIANAVTFVAYLLPFTVVLVAFIWAMRKLWLWRRPQVVAWRRAGGRQSPSR